MSEAEDGMAGVSDVANVVVAGDTDTVRLAAGIAPTDLKMVRSDDRQYLLIHCGDEFVAMYGSAGGSPASVEFADGGCYSVEELLDLVSAA
jgi:hypothetical protein